MLNSDNKKEATWFIVRLAVSAVVILVILLATWRVGRAGFASLLSTYASKSNRIAAAQAALSLSPNDPETHYVRGSILEADGDLVPRLSNTPKPPGCVPTTTSCG